MQTLDFMGGHLCFDSFLSVPPLFPLGGTRAEDRDRGVRQCHTVQFVPVRPRAKPGPDNVTAEGGQVGPCFVLFFELPIYQFV